MLLCQITETRREEFQRQSDPVHSWVWWDLPVTLGGSGVQGQLRLPRKLEVIIPETLFEKHKTNILKWTLQSPKNTPWERGWEDGEGGVCGGVLSPAYDMTLQV